MLTPFLLSSHSPPARVLGPPQKRQIKQDARQPGPGEKANIPKKLMATGKVFL